jgi:ATP-dependent DNA helicase RecG
LNLSTSIEFIKGIGPEKAKLLAAVLDIRTVEDLLTFYPIRYIDKSIIHNISSLQHNENSEILLKGKITELTENTIGKKRLNAKFSDGSGTINLVWFQYSRWMIDQIPQQEEVFVYGRVQEFNGYFSMPHPEIELVKKAQQETHLLPIYSSSEKLVKRGITQKFFQNIMKIICVEIPNLIQENISPEILQNERLMNRSTAYFNIHFPNDKSYQEQAEKRIKFEEAFFFQLSYGLKKIKHKSQSIGNPMPIVGDYFNDFYHQHLPFELTNAQKKVVKEIRNDLKKPIQMNRLLQGDVGSGKTMVALLSMLLVLDNGFQSCMMAPTEILATQHYNGIVDLLKNTGIKVALLTGSTKKAERKKIHEELLNKELSILIGTHALLEPIVQFQNLGLAIIDEQHRFGVEQRAKLWAKNKIPPHILVMTATPIPRTLAMSFYSDLDVSVIDEMPVGRKPIITAHRREKDKATVYQFIKEEIKKGRQIYFVYPLIEESETLDYKNLMEGFEQISNDFNNYNITILHGKMKPSEKENNMQYFASGDAQIMVATTVIEVGVNVPNASVMIIENAEKFGLSQLHQLRGRVGRGAEQSYCILMTSDKMSKDARVRINTMCQTNDGFKISEVDMQLRGPGDILGTQQSGVMDFKKLDLVNDGNIIKTTKAIVENILSFDPLLSYQQHQIIKKYYIEQYRQKHQWSKIS